MGMASENLHRKVVIVYYTPELASVASLMGAVLYSRNMTVTLHLILEWLRLLCGCQLFWII